MRGTHWGKGAISLQAAVPKKVPHATFNLIFFKTTNKKVHDYLGASGSNRFIHRVFGSMEVSTAEQGPTSFAIQQLMSSALRQIILR